MREFIKQNLAIVLAFILPVVLIAIVALSTYLPAMFITTEFHFIYASCDNNRGYYRYCNNYLHDRYSIIDGTLVENEVNQMQDIDGDKIPDRQEKYTSRLFFHDTKKNESREITLAEAQKLSLSGILTSPDGVTVSSNYDRRGDFFFIFDSGSTHGYYLTKGGSKKKLHLINENDRYYYQDNFRFLGWVVNDER